MAPVTPFLINVELYWPNGNRANQNEVARVRAFDVFNGTDTWEGESGYDMNTGGWQPVYMQNMSVFWSRDYPNLRLEVWSTSEQLLYSTQTFMSIASGSTVHIVIGQSASVGSGPSGDGWNVSGQITKSDGAALTAGSVKVRDVTGGVCADLGTGAIGQNGTYSVAFTTAAFTNNGTPHSNPNLQIEVFDASGTSLATSSVVSHASTAQVINMTVTTAGTSGARRVYGWVRNTIGLAVDGIRVRANHVVWASDGSIKEIPLGYADTHNGGGYEIYYQRPTVPPSTTPEAQINLSVIAVEPDASNDPGADEKLDSKGIYFDAPESQIVDLEVDRTANFNDSEYQRLDGALVAHFGGQRDATLNQMRSKPEYVSFVSKSIGWAEVHVQAYVDTDTVVQAVQKLVALADPQPIPLVERRPTVVNRTHLVYGLIRMGLGNTIEGLVDAGSDRAFNAIVEAVHRGIVSRGVELDLTNVFGYWCDVLTAAMSKAGTSTDPALWQQALLQLVFGASDAGVVKQKDVVAALSEWSGSFAELCDDLADHGKISQPEAQELQFLFELNHELNGFFPLIKEIHEQNTTVVRWRTLADLATVPVQTDGYGPGWYQLAMSMELPTRQEKDNTSTRIFPGDVPGANDNEKCLVIARRMYDKFGDIGPQERFRDEMKREIAAGGAVPLPVKHVAQFLSAHADYSLQETNYDAYAAASSTPLGLEEDDLAFLKAAQRVFRLTSKYQAVRSLVEAKLDSAFKIAQLDEDDFIVGYQASVGGLTAARRIHRLAAQVTGELLLTAVKYNTSLTSVGGATALSNGVQLASLSTTTADSTGAAVVHYPDWKTLFGGMNQCACKDCQTVFSPGAYMVDLLQFVSKKLRRNVFERRPDLQHIEVSCPNTNSMLPYIDLVNETLESVIAPDVFDLESTDAAGARTPIAKAELDGSVSPAPISEAIKQVFASRSFVLSNTCVLRHRADGNEQAWIIEDGAWRFAIGPTVSTTDAYKVVPARQTSAKNDSLEVFPEHHNAAAYTTLGESVYPFNLPFALGKEETGLFLQNRKVGWHEIVRAFDKQTPADKLKNGVGALQYLQLTPQEADSILGKGQDPAAYWGFAAEPGVTPPAVPTWVTSLSKVGVFLQRSGLTYQELLDLLDTRFVHGKQGPALELSYDKDSDAAECQYEKLNIEHLTVESCARISFFVRLWRRIGWSMRDLDCFLVALEDNQIPPDLIMLSLVKQLSDELKVAPRALIAWWTPMDTRRTQRGPKSLFDDVFLVGPRTQGEWRTMEAIAQGGKETIDPALQAPGQDIVAYLRAGLGVRARDMEALWNQVMYPGKAPGDEGYGKAADLDLDKVTRMYRATTLGGALGVAVGEILEMNQLLGDWPFFTIALVGRGTVLDTIVATWQYLDNIRRIRSTGLSVPEIAYLLKHVTQPGLGPTVEDHDDAIRKLATASASIATTYPELATPDAAALTKLLAKLVSAEQAAGLVRVIAGPRQGDDADYSKTVSRFGSAMGAVGLQLSAYNAFVPGRTASSRYAQAYPVVRALVLDRCRIESAIEVVAELGGIDKDAADLLLSKCLPSLTSPADTSKHALADWKTLLCGGWVETSTDANLPVLKTSVVGTWRSTVVVPKDGSFTFYVPLSVSELRQWTDAAPVTLSVDGKGMVSKLVTPALGAAQSKAAVFRFDPPQQASNAYKAGTVLQVELELPSNSVSMEVTLAWASEGEESAAVPVTSTIPWRRAPVAAGGPAANGLPDSYLQLVKAVAMVKGLKLSRRELQYLATDPYYLPLVSELPLATLGQGDLGVQWTVLSDFIHLLDLSRALPFKQGSLFDILEAPDDFEEKDLAALLDWRVEDVQAVKKAYDDAAPWSDTSLWHMLRACQSIVTRLDLRAEQILNLLVTNAPTSAAALILRSAYRSRFNKAAWKAAFKEPSDGLRRKKRDALVSHLLHVGAGASEFKDENDLFGYYLVDVEMEPDTLISRLKLALNAIQLYVQRVFWGLEGTLDFADMNKARAQWEWMKNYRVWEANRKVFLYPENWIEPELRDDKSPFFKELEEELTQGEISDERARAALSHYLEKLVEVANLVVVGSFVQPINGGGVSYMMHIVARARSQGHTFFQRTYTAKQSGSGTWSPWKKIELEIKAEVVAPVIFNSRLHLFWPVVVTKQQPQKVKAGTFVDGDDATEERQQYVSEIQLMSAEFQATLDRWSKPRLTKSKATDWEVQRTTDRPVGQDEPDTDCYHLRVERPSNELLSIALLKSAPPSNGALSIKQLGVFKVLANGFDRFESSTGSLALGPMWPVGTQLKANRAEECNCVVDNESPGDAFRLKSSVEFLGRTPDSFSVFSPNFGYVQGAEAGPSFFDTQSRSMFVVNGPDRALSGMQKVRTPVASFQTFHHPLARELQGLLQSFGPPGIMNRLTQALPASENYYYNYAQGKASYYYNYYGGVYLGYHIAGDTMAWGSGQRKFEIEYAPSADTVLRPYPLPTIEFGQGTSMGLYNWELFFHAPMVIAARLSADLKFEDAMNWLHYVFDPRQDFNDYEKTKEWAYDLPPGARFWTFLPFFANRDATKSLTDTVNATTTARSNSYERQQFEAQVEEWRNNPFSPHLIARQRMAAYQKNVVMKYLDNIISWADWLFRQDAWEPINEATQLYILAAEILGKRPEVVESVEKERRLSYAELSSIGLDAFSQSLAEAEYALVRSAAYLKNAEPPARRPGTEHIQGMVAQSAYFAIPRNPKLDTYWDTVADRLFKIRNSMNIDGVKRQLALFEPPIDPALLVRARAAGVDMSSVLPQVNAPLPHYRFNVWLQKALDLCNELKTFGSAVLSAYEKQDAEELQGLRQTHEIKMLELTRKVRQAQIQEAETNIQALEKSADLIDARYDYYASRQKVSQDEKNQLSKTNAAKWLEVTQSGLHAVAASLSVNPDFKVGMVGPFPLGNADLKVGTALVNTANSLAAAAGGFAAYTRGEASLSGLNASFNRRWEEWQHQLALAAIEKEQIKKQKLSAEIRRDIAERELDNLEVQIDNANQVQDFFKGKFTSRELYRWMVGELSRTFQQVYRLAFDAAKTAEHAYQFELGADAQFVQFDYAGSLKQSLLTGEKLAADLKRMDVAYLENNKREYEVTKSISLNMLDAEALQALRSTGSCTFDLSELLFDLDFPGHHFRRIKAVRVSIPCVTGPHTSVSATLTLLNSAIRKVATGATSYQDYPCTGYEDRRFVQDLTGVQSIATSTGQNDGGVFELNFRDERYLPFEGSGVISRWRLELPKASDGNANRWQFDYSTISDVVLHVSYTAREGGDTLKTAANDTIAHTLTNLRQAFDPGNDGKLAVAVSLKQDFPDVLAALADPDSTSVSLAFPEELFPYILRSKLPVATDLSVTQYKKPKGGQYTSDGGVTIVGDTKLPVGGWTWSLSVPASGKAAFGTMDDVLFVVTFKVA